MIVALCAGFVELPGDEANSHEPRGENDAPDKARAVEFAPLVGRRLSWGGGRSFGGHIRGVGGCDDSGRWRYSRVFSCRRECRGGSFRGSCHFGGSYRLGWEGYRGSGRKHGNIARDRTW